MKLRLLIILLAFQLNSCIPPIILLREEISVQDQDVPYKNYQLTGNTCQTSDGGLATVLVRYATNAKTGTPVSFGTFLDRYEVVVVKTSFAGQVQWTNIVFTYVNPVNSRPLIHPLNDGGLVVVASVPRHKQETGKSRNELITILLTDEGEVQSRDHKDTSSDILDLYLYNLLSLPDGSMAITGRMEVQKGAAPCLFNFDKNGELTKFNIYFYEPGVYDKNPITIARTRDGGFIMAWHGRNSDQQIEQTFLLKTHASGILQWQRKYALFGAKFAIPAIDKGYILHATIPNSQTNTYFYKLSEIGDINLVKSFSLSNLRGNITLLGVFPYSNSYTCIYNIQGIGIQLLSANLDGDVQYQETVKISILNQPIDAIRMKEGNFVVSGQDGNGNIYLYRITENATVRWSTIIASNN